MRSSFALVALASLLAACGGTPSGGDPGGHRLRELSHDRVFARLPPGSTASSLEKTPAAYRRASFTGGGWRGPAVVLSFTNAGDPAAVARDVGRRAAAAGWAPKAVGAVGVTDRWTKTFPDGAAATLVLAQLRRGAYRLSAGIAPVRG